MAGNGNWIINLFDDENDAVNINNNKPINDNTIVAPLHQPLNNIDTITHRSYNIHGKCTG